MERDYGQELDQLKEQMEALRQEMASQVERLREEAQAALPNQPTMERLGRVEVPRGMHPDSRLSQQMEELCRRTEAQGASGYVTYLGVYNAGGRQSNWIRNAVSADGLLAQIESGVAEKVLACIGNANRLALLLEILRGPKTVAQLVDTCGFGSTGQAYHHMKPLLAADLIQEEGRGVYVCCPHKVQGIIMLLAGISDMVDETYTQGAWDSPQEE